ncbi:hypothetical protein LTR64_001515 [Lithohypha guttulata]|uniref:uncharacterized protein n=1 Tax=Lithohypha guttulata TaxID=1690604 RepID=UPI002DDFFAD0|nr:hypothetical protein LTR51_003709 [Lithohypha guttulata]
MSGITKHNEACCKIPPIVDEGYSPKGKYIELNGTKTYVTGPDTATSAILSIYDIFGFFPQTIQGADILAYSDSEHPYQVFMPDFFEGNPADMAWYPPNNEDKKQKFNDWFKSAAPPKHLPKVPQLIKAAEEQNKSIKSWGVIGYCWGGKMTSIIASKNNFKAAVQTSPAMVDSSDAEKVVIPMMVLASKDEPVEEVKKYGEKLTVKNHIETFDDQLHGFMSARADLKDEKVKKEYERGYRLALQFFHEHL